VELEIRRGQAKQRVRPVPPPVYLIGAARDCDMVLGDPRYPEVYASLFVSQRGVSLRQLAGGPALLVNGSPLRSTILENGDLIRTANFEFVMRIQWPAQHVESSGMGVNSTRRIRMQLSQHDAQEGHRQVMQLLRDVQQEFFPAALPRTNTTARRHSA